MKNDFLQQKIIRYSLILIVISLLIGLAVHSANNTHSIAEKNIVESVAGAKDKANSADSDGEADVEFVVNADVNSDINTDLGTDSKLSESDGPVEKSDVEFKSGPIIEPVPYFDSGGKYKATDPEEIELLKQYPDVVDMNFEGGTYYYNPLEQWRYNKIMDRYDELPTYLQDLLLNRPQSIHFVYKYFDYLENPQNYDPNAKSNRVDFAKAKSKSKYPFYSNWDCTWGYLDYSKGDIANSGCGPVNFAMLVAGMNQDETMTPTKAREFARKNGYEDINGKGSLWDLFTIGVKDFGIKSEVLNCREPGQIAHALQAGKPVILIINNPQFTSVGHFILLHDIEGDMVKLQDGNSISNTNKMWNLPELLQEAEAAWSFCK